MMNERILKRLRESADILIVLGAWNEDPIYFYF